MALEHADGEGQRRVDGEDPQQPLGQRDLVGRQLLAEDHIAVGQPEADGQHRRPQQQIGQQEHAVELGAALLVAGGPEAGVVPDVGTAQAEAQQIQIGDDGQHRLVYAELAVTQLPQHDGRIDQRDDGAQRHGNVAQRGARPDLIYLQRRTSFPALVSNIALYYSPKGGGCKVEPR